ncbi:hypothetical protein Leryth_016632, partial [Lithospermum erythrorhizon]
EFGAKSQNLDYTGENVVKFTDQCNMESLTQLEVLCETLYNSQDTAARAHAESSLKCFSVNVEYIPQCQYILDNALTPYALMLASSSLLKQVTEHSLSLQLRLDIRNYLINYLATRGPKLQSFVIGSLIQLLCRITKFGWLDDDKFREVVQESINFLNQATSGHYAIGLKILNQLVSEMNQSSPGLPSTRHRRVACSFRDQSLFQIFQISRTSLGQLKNDDASISHLQELAASLSLKCLSFDFVGTIIDESSEEFGTIQIPAAWTPIFEESSILQIFFDYYSISTPPISKQALECLVRLASVRRTLSELVNMEGYSHWIQLVAEFTSKSLQSWQYIESMLENHSVYERSSMSIMNTMEPILQIYMSIGSSSESQDVIDAELSVRVLRLRCGELSKQRLDRAILVFFQHFRKSYVGDHVLHTSKLYARLSELLGLNDHLMLLDFFVRKIATNLKCYAECEEVIDQTLNLFWELASGFTTGKILLKLDTVKFIVAHHTRDHYPFLDERRCSRSRTTFYHTIGCLIFLEDSSLLFKSSMESLLKVFISLETTPDEVFRTDTVKYALIGLMRDLRGIAMATNNRRTFGLLFDWLYPVHMPVLLKAISYWADTPEVTTPLLKFMAEFVMNKSQRLTFDSSSPNGILLFREVSKLIVSYGSRILSLPKVTDIYGFKYKGIWISLTILSRALAGNYVNFGVFELYGDRALADALDVALNMILLIPLPDILVYRKLSKAYYAFLEVLFSNHILFILNLDANSFMHIVASLDAGLKALDGGISSQCASAIDNLAVFYFNNITMGEAPMSTAAINLSRHVADCPNLLPEIYTDLRTHILAAQPADQHLRLVSCFDKLMVDIARSLDAKNREKFTQNLTTFRREFRIK